MPKKMMLRVVHETRVERTYEAASDPKEGKRLVKEAIIERTYECENFDDEYGVDDFLDEVEETDEA
jgi:hypothetical protein